MIMNKDMSFHHHHHNHHQQVIAEENMSNLTSASGDQASVSSGNRTEASGSNFINPQQQEQHQQFFVQQSQDQSSSQPLKKKRNQPGNPDPEAEVIALSPKTLLATNRFICEICNKGFQRDQNLQLHRRGHNLPWKLKQRSKTEVIRKKVYICPESSCVHHDPSRALGDLTGIKKHFCRKHGEKKWKCEKCSKRYAVQSDWKAHSKTCGTKEYRCDCGTLFSRRDSFITHRAFCDALAEESAKAIPNHLTIQSSSSLQTQLNNASSSSSHHHHHHNNNIIMNHHIPNLESYGGTNSSSSTSNGFSMKKEQHNDVNYTVRPQDSHQIIPPWLAPPPGPTSPPSVFSHQRDLTSSNPNPNGGGGTSGLFPFGSATAAAASFHHPPPPSPAAMSATALLQRAAQMGSTKSTPSSANEIRSSSSHNLTTTMAAMMTSSASTPEYGFAGGHANNSSMFQDYNTMNPTAGFDHGEAFGESFSGFLRTSAMTAAPAPGDKNGGGGIGEGLTRDFLGLRALSHSDFLNFAGLGDCINGNASEQQQENGHSQKPWQG